jgi:hypothetical protein
MSRSNRSPRKTSRGIPRRRGNFLSGFGIFDESLHCVRKCAVIVDGNQNASARRLDYFSKRGNGGANHWNAGRHRFGGNHPKSFEP